jgi:hypothetical protein
MEAESARALTTKKCPSAETLGLGSRSNENHENIYLKTGR